MKTPRFTDLKRYPNGYRTAAGTNIRLTFMRAKAAMKAGAEERKAKVAPLAKRVK